MAKLLGSSCHSARPPRGLLLVLVLLLLASIKVACPVMAEPEDLIVNGLEKLTTAALGKIEGMEDFAKGLKGGFKAHKIYLKVQALINRQNPGATYFVDTVNITGGPRGTTALPVVAANITANPAVRTGLCATGVSGSSWVRRHVTLLGDSGTDILGDLDGMLQVCPDDGGKWAVLGLGSGGDLSTRFRTFSYLVTSDAYTVVWFPVPPASHQRQQQETGGTTLYYYPNDGLYYVDITGIRVGQHTVQTTATAQQGSTFGSTAAYLSTTQPYTYLERGMYDSLKETLTSQIQTRNSGAMPARRPGEKLCYDYEGTALTVPTMAILFAGGNAAFMELRGPNVWYAEGSSICLAILPTPPPLLGQKEVSIIGTRMQSGRPMTVDLTAGGGQGALTFPAICDVTSCLLSNSKRTSRVSAATYVLYFAVPLLVLLSQPGCVVII